jgi:hypothetical protein
MHIGGKLISLRHEFVFFGNQGDQLGTIKKKLAKLFGSEYWIEQNGLETMRIYGNFVQFGISITGQIDHRFVIGSVIVIEHEEVSEKNK